MQHANGDDPSTDAGAGELDWWLANAIIGSSFTGVFETSQTDCESLVQQDNSRVNEKLTS